jgi:hypothetical protein
MNLLTSMAQEILNEHGYHMVLGEDDTKGLYTQVHLNSGIMGIVLETDDDPHEVTLYVYLPEVVPEKKRYTVMEYLTRVNYHLPMGHFEMDLDAGKLRFLTGQIMEGTDLSAKVLLILMRNALDRVETFFPGVLRIVHGHLHAIAALTEVEQKHGYAGRHVGTYLSQTLN